MINILIRSEITRINLEINESDTSMTKYLLIFYENPLRKSMSSFRQYHLLSSGNKQDQKKNEINCLGILIDDDVDQFDRPKEEKILVFSLNQWYINSN